MADYNSFGEFATALQRAYDGIDVAVEQAVRSNIDDLLKNIRLRVSGSGKNADGVSFSTSYSRSHASTPYSKSHAYKRKKYGQGSLGQQVGYKGFYYQGTLWDNFRMLNLINSKQNVKAVLGFAGNNAYLSNERINEIQSSREGIPIAAANKEEGQEFVKNIGFAIGEYLKSVL